MTVNVDYRTDNLMRNTVSVRIHSLPFREVSKHKLHLREQLIQRLARIDHIGLTKISDVGRAVAGNIRENVAEATTGLQRRRAERQRKVVNQKRPVGHTQTVIESDVVPDAVLKQQQRERLGTMQAQGGGVQDSL